MSGELVRGWAVNGERERTIRCFTLQYRMANNSTIEWTERCNGMVRLGMEKATKHGIYWRRNTFVPMHSVSNSFSVAFHRNQLKYGFYFSEQHQQMQHNASSQCTCVLWCVPWLIPISYVFYVNVQISWYTQARAAISPCPFAHPFIRPFTFARNESEGEKCWFLSTMSIVWCVRQLQLRADRLGSQINVRFPMWTSPGKNGKYPLWWSILCYNTFSIGFSDWVFNSIWFKQK